MRIFKFTLISMIFFTSLLATDPHEWAADAAKLLEPGQRQIGVFQPWRIGLSERFEVSTHPVLFLAIPNLSLKMSHGSLMSFELGSRHSLTYPSPLLKAVSKEGIGGMISPEFDIPHILHHKSEILLSKAISDDLLLNCKAGLAIALGAGDLDPRTSMDLPLLYPRWATWYSGYGLITGGEMIYDISDKLAVQSDVDILIHSEETGGLALEHKSLLHVSRKSDRRFSLGYKLSYAEYPFGKQIHLLGPIFDFQWSWKK